MTITIAVEGRIATATATTQVVAGNTYPVALSLDSEWTGSLFMRVRFGSLYYDIPFASSDATVDVQFPVGYPEVGIGVFSEALQVCTNEVRIRLLRSILEAGEQVRRVAQRFAVVSVAGAFAKAAGVLPAELDEAGAVRSCFSAWLENRGGVGASEDAAILSAVRLFIEQHGASRFQDIEREGAVCVNRVGFRRKAGGGTEFILLSESFKEVVRGFAEKRAKEVLYAAGWLKPGEKGKYTAKVTLPELQRVNCYVVVLPEE